MRLLLISLLCVFMASVCQAAPTRLKFLQYSTADGTSCSVIGSDLIGNKRSENTDLIPNVSSARVYNLGTKNRGTFSFYSTALTNSYVWVSCYNTSTGAATAARIFFDSTSTVTFPLTDKFIRVR